MGKAKKFMLLLLTLFILCCTSVYAADNLISNGVFTENSFVSDGWRFKEKGRWFLESGNPAQIVSDENGQNSLKINNGLLTQRVELKRNVKYILEFDVKSSADAELKVGFMDGSKDWPGGYAITSDLIETSKEYSTEKIEFECADSHDYVLYFEFWKDVDLYLENVTLTEAPSYISRVMTGVNANGEISFSANFKSAASFFCTALYNEENMLVGIIPESEKGTFSAVSGYGKYKIKNYLFDKHSQQMKEQDIVYDENSAENENNSLGKAKSLELSAHNVDINTDSAPIVLDAVITPKYAYDNNVVWTSSDISVAEVSQNGIVTPKKEGQTTITALSGELSDTCTVNVSSPVRASGIMLDKNSMELYEIDSVGIINAQVIPAKASNKNVAWHSDNSAVAVVTDGVVTAVGAGTAVITAVSEDGKYSAECTVTVKVSENTITNDRFYKDNDGNNIYSQGGGIYKFGDKYYWYGVKYKEAPQYAQRPEDGKCGNASYESFTCYSSADLVNWKFENEWTLDDNQGWVGRMGVAYNSNTNQYVLISQHYKGMLFAVSDKPEGPFTLHHYMTDIPFENNGTGDQTIFCDDDGKAYLICSSANGRAYQYVTPLRESDFLDIDRDKINMIYYDENGDYTDQNGTVGTKDKLGIEGNCMFKYNGNYYYTGSDLYGWNSSRVYVLQSDDILGKYNSDTGLPYIMNDTASSYAHNSQAGFYVTIHGKKQDLVMYCGDRWSDFAGNGTGYNQWIPISMTEDGKPYFNNLHQWKLDAENGTWEVGEGNNYISNPEFEADRVAVVKPVGWNVADNVGGYVNGNLRGKQSTGNFVWQQTAPEDYKAELSQTVKDLPNGTYTMTAWVKSSGGQNICSLYAESGNVRKTYSVKTEIADWTEVVVADDIVVTDGQCNVGLYSDAPADSWVQIDNVRLVKNTD